MKKSRLIQYISLPLLVIMYSCSNDVEKSDIPVIVPSANEITFSVGSVSDSRATIMDNSNFVADGRTIGIYANKHKGNLSNSAFSANVMNNEELVYKNGIWSYSPMQFWSDNQDTLYSFVAYFPYNNSTQNINNGRIVVPYTCAANNNEQVDLLWGVTQNINTPNSPVSLHLEHALSKVVFNIDGLVEGSDINNVEITNVTIKGLSNSADFSINAYSNESSWSNYTNVANILVSNESLILTNSKSQIGEPLLLIPQDLTNAKLVIDYNIIGKSELRVDSKRVEIELLKATIIEWCANQSYVYNLNLTLNGVDFTVTVSEFEEQVDIPVDVPEGENIGFVAPGADYLLDIQVVQDCEWGATYISLDGTQVSGWGSFSDPDTYVNPIDDISVDITSEIEVALGISDGSLESELTAGNVLMGAYNSENEFLDSREEKTANYFFFYDKYGAAVDMSSACCVIDNFFDVANELVRLYGTCMVWPNRAIAGQTFLSYIVFKNSDNSEEYVVQVNQHVVAVPEEIPYTVVEEYAIMYSVPYDENYTNFASDEYNLSVDMLSEIENLIGGKVDEIYYKQSDGEYIDGSDNDWWFGENGACEWGNEALVHMIPIVHETSYSFSSILVYPNYDAPTVGRVAKCTYQYCCSSTRKAVNIEYVVTIVEPE